MNNKKSLQLDPDEQQILNDYDNDQYVSTGDVVEERQRLAKYAKAALTKDKSINIRISETDLTKLKARAVEIGMPYQTLLSVLIHQFTNRRISLRF